jgi:hypothetical protein
MGLSEVSPGCEYSVEGRECSGDAGEPMQLKDEDLWAIATGKDFSGVERHFLVYANRRGFTITSRTKESHSTLKELTEGNVKEEIALLHRVSIDRFQHRPRPVHLMSSNDSRLVSS